MPRRSRGALRRTCRARPAPFLVPQTWQRARRKERALTHGHFAQLRGHWAVLEEQGLLQRDAAKLFGCTQPEISVLANYKLRGFSVIRLMEFLTVLDRDVEIGIRKIQRHGHIKVQELEPA